MQHEPAKSTALQVRFWGARGSIPTPSAANLRYGGNTTCLQILVPGSSGTGRDTILLDAGTGIHALGHHLPATNIHLFFTHFHWDHIQGLPGFAPLFPAGNTLTFHSTRPADELRATLRAQMTFPYFPVEFDSLASTLHFHQLPADGLTLDDLTIQPFALHHPGGSTGYRITRQGHTVVFATDHEHGNPAADARLLEAATNADVLIYDAQYTPETYPHRIGWGHSTWLEGTRLATRAGVKQLVLFHHDPWHDDATIDSLVASAQNHFPNTIAASEGLTLNLG